MLNKTVQNQMLYTCKDLYSFQDGGIPQHVASALVDISILDFGVIG